MAKIEDILRGGHLALSAGHAGLYISAASPALDFAQQADAAGTGASPVAFAAGPDLRVEPGQRYAVSRGLAVMPVRGVLTPNMHMFERYLGWATYHGMTQALAELDANEEVAGIVLEFDSPGGMVLGCSGAAAAIAATQKPVHALVHPLAASAAYWLASQCDDITMTPGSEVGSIGVIGQAVDPAAPDMFGDQWTTVRSTHARAKNSEALTAEGRALLQAQVDKAERAFHEAVASGRGLDVNTLPERLSMTADRRDGGSVYDGRDALERGLVDVIDADRTAFYGALGAQYAPRSSARAGVRTGGRALAAAAKARASI